MISRILIGLLATCALFGAPNELIVGTTGGYAPFASVNEAGEMEGFDIDVAKALAARLNKQLVLKDLGNMPSLLMALKLKKVDCVIWAVSITKARQEKMFLIHYQGDAVTSIPMLFWGKAPEGQKCPEDVVKAGGMMVVEAGSFQEQLLQKLPAAQVRPVTSIVDALLELRYGKAQATLADPGLITKIVSTQPEVKVVLVPLEESDMAFGNGICVDKSNEALAQEIELAIAAMKSDQTIAKLEALWMK